MGIGKFAVIFYRDIYQDIYRDNFLFEINQKSKVCGFKRNASGSTVIL